jgi:single-strand DNA-binding protein
MTEASVGFAGNLTDQPELRHTDGGIARAMFRVAVSGRREQEASFFTVIVWRDQAEHAAESLSKGSRVVVVGRLQQRSWTAEDGSARQTVEVVAEELGPSLRWRRRPRPGRRGARRSSQLDRRCDGAGRGRACSRPAPSGPEALPAVESDSASPGLGDRGLLGHAPGRRDEDTWRSEAEQHLRRGSPPAPRQESAAAPPRAPRRTWPQTRSHRRWG